MRRPPQYVITLWVNPQVRERFPGLPRSVAEAEAEAEGAAQAAAESEAELEAEI